MPDTVPDKYQPSKEIRVNSRFAAYEGTYGGEKVFIKYATDPSLKDRLSTEAAGLNAMRQLDPNETLYHAPEVVELTDEYIATEWADGVPMAHDFEAMDMSKIEQDLHYLTRLYAFVDQHGAPGTMGHEAVVQMIDRCVEKLKKHHYETYFSETLVAELVDHVKMTFQSFETRTTNGDLQPGNIMVADGQKPTIIDCETYRDSWPRHYNIANFAFNYGADYPELRPQLRNMVAEYGQMVGVNSGDTIASFNLSTAIRSLQIIDERLSDGTSSSDIKEYVETTMRTILGQT